MSTTLPLFWDLSSVEKKKRLDASVKLVSTLEKFQVAFEHRSADSDASSNEDDSGREEDGLDVGVVGNMEYDSMLDALNAPDVAYSIRRLVRGLGSPRESSRLGFAVALTELLSRITTVSCAQILALLLDATRTSGNQTGQEERDLLFARLFGLTAIIHSGLLLRTHPPLPRSASSPSTPESCAAVLGALRALAHAKSWLAEPAYWAIGRAMDCFAAVAEEDVPWREEAIRNLFEEVFGESSSADEGAPKSGNMWTPEKIALALRAQRLWPGREQEWRKLWSPTIKHGDVLHLANLMVLARILRESEVEDDEGGTKISGRAWRPKIHHVWDQLLDELLPPDGSGRSPAGSFQEFFRIVVDESLFSGSASNERKYWGFVIVQRALPRVKAADLPMLFAKNFMRTWINHLSHYDRYLHSFAKQIAKEIVSVVQKDPTLGFAFILQLTGVHGNQQFDKLTKTTTVESILKRMSAEDIKNYIAHLLGQADAGPGSRQSDNQVIDARRSWIIEQFAALVRKGTIPRSDEWVQVILEWFVVHGTFTIKKKSQKSSISVIHSVPSPPYSDHLRRQCRERLLGCLADLTQLSIVTKTGEKVQRFTGISLDGQLWLSRVVEIIRKLEQDSKHVALLSELDEDDRRKLEHAHKTVAWLKKVSGDQREQAEGVELLLQSFIIQFYIEDSSEGRDTALLESCIDSASCLFHPTTEKFNVLESPRDDELQQPPPEPIDVIVDIIIGCLEKGTAYMRVVGVRSFSLLSGVVKDSTINLILSQLERRDTWELLADSDEEGDKSDDEYLESGDNCDKLSSAGVEGGESDETRDEGLTSITEIPQTKGIVAMDESADEESGRELDDDQMMAIDDELALMFKDHVKRRKDKDGAQREAIHFKNRIMDLLDIFVKRQPTSPLVLQFLVPLLALTFSDDKQVSEKATGLLMSRIGRLKEIPSGIDIAKSSVILDNLHIRARKVRSRDAVAIISRCSLYVSRALLHVGADETVRMAYTMSLVNFTERKASNLNGQFFSEFIKRYPHTAWGMRAALLSAPTKAINSYRRGQAYMLLETLLNHLPCPPDQELDSIASYIRELQFGLYNTLSIACDPCLKSVSISSIKEALKLVLIAARTTKRLVAKYGSFSNIWDPIVWTELHQRLVAQDRFKASTALVGMCRQVIQLVQTQQALPSTGAGECLEKGQRDEVTAGNKRKAETNDVDVTGKKFKRVSTFATRGPAGKKSK